MCIYIHLEFFPPGSGGLNALVFFGQMITTAMRLDCMGTIPLGTIFPNTKIDDNADNALEFIYGIWNLDFTYPANSFCFAEHFHNIQVLTLNYFVASLPLVVVIFLALQVKCFGKILNCVGRTFGETCYSYVTCGCLWRCRWLTMSVRFNKWASIKTLVASCILLSYTKFTMTTIYLLAPMSLFNSSGHPSDKVLYYQGDLEYFGHHHMCYGILAVFFLLTFVIGFPMFLLCLRYKPFKDNVLNPYDACGKSTLFYLDEFLDACILKPFQRDLKWGKNKSEPCIGMRWWRFSFGIHDYRWYAGWYFILRFSLFAANLFAMDFVLQLLLNEILSMLALAVSLIVQPYKKRIHNQIDAFVLILISVINLSIFFEYYLTNTEQKLSKSSLIIQYVLVFIPAVMIAVQFFAKIFVNYRLGQRHEIEDEISVVSVSRPLSSSSSRRRTHNFVRSGSPLSFLVTKETSFYHRYLCNCYRHGFEEEREGGRGSPNNYTEIHHEEERRRRNLSINATTPLI